MAKPTNPNRVGGDFLGVWEKTYCGLRCPITNTTFEIHGRVNSFPVHRNTKILLLTFRLDSNLSDLETIVLINKFMSYFGG